MQKINFYDRKHMDFYMQVSAEIKEIRHVEELDSYQKALIYSLGMIADCRMHFDEIYSIATNEINPDVLQAGWQTSGSTQITLFAFNLWNNFSPENSPESVSVSTLFSGNPRFTPFLFEAIKIRFAHKDEPEYDVVDEDGIVEHSRVSHDLAKIYAACAPGHNITPSENLSMYI